MRNFIVYIDNTSGTMEFTSGDQAGVRGAHTCQRRDWQGGTFRARESF